MTSSEESLNQPPPLVDYNLFSSVRVLHQALAREGAGWACLAKPFHPAGLAKAVREALDAR